jgi:hypothetical protein
MGYTLGKPDTKLKSDYLGLKCGIGSEKRLYWALKSDYFRLKFSTIITDYTSIMAKTDYFRIEINTKSIHILQPA